MIKSHMRCGAIAANGATAATTTAAAEALTIAEVRHARLISSHAMITTSGTRPHSFTEVPRPRKVPATTADTIPTRGLGSATNATRRASKTTDSSIVVRSTWMAGVHSA